MAQKIFYLAVGALVISMLLVFQYGKSNLTSLGDMHFSYQSAENWNGMHFDDSGWKGTGKSFLTYNNTNLASGIYFRQFFESQGDSAVVSITAVDCIDEIHLNGKILFSGNCDSCKHCRGDEFLLQPLNSGINLLAIKTKPLEGPFYLLKTGIVKSNTPFIFIILAILLFAYLLSLRNLPKSSTILYTLIFSFIIASVSSILGFVEYSSASLLIVISCIVFLIIAGEQALDKGFVMLVFFLILASGFLLPIFKNTDYLGRQDWNGFYALTYIPIKEFLEYHQLPLWNPYLCGGMSLIGEPEVGFYSPQVIPILLLGLNLGIRINLLLHLAFALFGMWLLGRHFGLKGYSRLFPPFVYALSSIYFKHLWEGHYTWIAHAWIPFVFYYYLEGLKDWRNLVISGLFCALILFNGNVNYLGYAFLLIGFYGLLETARRVINSKENQGFKQKLMPLSSLALIVLVFMLISAVKFVPLIEFSLNMPRYLPENLKLNAVQNLGGLFTSLTDSNLADKWHETSAYIGFIALGIIILGILLKWRSNLPLVLTSFFFLLIVLNNTHPSIWDLISKLPLYNSIRVVSRVVSIAILASSIFGGFALMAIYSYNRNLAKIILAMVLLNLFFVTPFMLEEWFSIEPIPLEPAGDFRQTKYVFNSSYEVLASHYMLKSAMENKGVTNCLNTISSLASPLKAVPYGNESYLGEAYLANNSGDAIILEFTPNSVTVAVDAKSSDYLVLNQNYYPGWRSSAGAVESYNGLLSVKIKPGQSNVVFYYMPYSFIMGVTITIITILALTWFFCFRKKKSA